MPAKRTARSSVTTEPQIVEMAPQRMAVVRTVGRPDQAAQRAFPALYGAVYTLKFALKKQGVEYKVAAPRARWPDLQSTPVDQWRAEWALPLPEDTREVVQKDPDVPVTVETWEYGTIAQVLHVGPYSEERPTVERLHRFIAEQGYEIAGAHEEEYLTTPKAKVQKCVIRYAIRRKQDTPAR